MADNHFTVLVFTAATGEPIMVAVILKSEKTRDKMPSNWMLGLDYLKMKGVDLSDAMAVNDVDLFIDKKEAMCGGPTSTFQGKEIPCHVNVSPNASITSAMLAEMLSDIDQS